MSKTFKVNVLVLSVINILKSGSLDMDINV